jgi:glycine cleavage system H protein
VLETGQHLRIGIADFVQQRSGDVAFAEVKPAGSRLLAGEELGVIETIKVNISLESPVSGVIRLVNPLMESAPETINLDPYGEGWLVEMESSDWEADRLHLLDDAAYFAQMKVDAQEATKR